MTISRLCSAIVILGILSGLSVVRPVNAESPSFSCDGDLNDTEAAICSVDQLSQLDNLQNQGYQQIRNLFGKKAANTLARSLLAKRNSCGGNVDCIADAQIAAIEMFNSRGASVEIPSELMVGGSRERSTSQQQQSQPEQPVTDQSSAGSARSAANKQDAIPEIKQLVSLIGQNNAAFGEGKFHVFYGKDLPDDTMNGRCSVAVLFMHDEPRGRQQNFDGSNTLSVAGDYIQIDLSFLSRYDEKPNLIGNRQEVCVKYDENSQCLNRMVSIKIFASRYLSREEDTRFFSSQPVWLRPDGSLFVPSADDWRNNPLLAAEGRHAAAYFGGVPQNNDMNFMFRPEELDIGVNLMKNIMSKCIASDF